MSDKTDTRDIKASPYYERVIDELQVARDNLPVGTSDSVRDKFDSLRSDLITMAGKHTQSASDREEQEAAEAEAKMPR